MVDPKLDTPCCELELLVAVAVVVALLVVVCVVAVVVAEVVTVWPNKNPPSEPKHKTEATTTAFFNFCVKASACALDIFTFVGTFDGVTVGGRCVCVFIYCILYVLAIIVMYVCFSVLKSYFSRHSYSSSETLRFYWRIMRNFSCRFTSSGGVL